ncbi:MAG: ribonuclease Y, partial [bacterium]
QSNKEKIIWDNEKLLEKARKEAEEINKKAIEKFELINKEWDKIENMKIELWEKEKQLSVKLKEIDIKKGELEQKQQELLAKEKEIEEKMKYVNELKSKAEEELLKISNLKPEEAKEIVLKKTEESMKTELLVISQKIEQEYMKNTEFKAKRILLNTLSRLTADTVAESTTAPIVLPSEELKGRIIGKEGRNIKAFEEITGVDLIIDDNSDVVLVSSFDPIRREKARLTLEKLISIGKINPIAIQEVYDQIEKEINLRIQEEGENAAIQAKVYDLHPDLINILGKMKYRTSYGQNLLKHSIQVSQIATILASELGADVEICRRAALLHDIGKVLEETNGEPHAIAGAKIAKIYGEKDEVVRAIASHHNEVPQETIEDLIVQIADAISASRPGARRETYQLYIQRLQKLEELAMSFSGVEKAYVLQGGKEVIIFVKPDMVLDNEVYKLAKDIAKAIENNLKYPGLIRVTVIRKIIAVQTAK